MKHLFFLLAFLLVNSLAPAQEAKDPVKLKLALIDALQDAPADFFTANNVWFLQQLAKGKAWEDIEGSRIPMKESEALEESTVASLRDQSRSSVLQIESAASLSRVAEILLDPEPEDAPEPELEEQIDHAIVTEGRDKAAEIMENLFSDEEKELKNMRQYEAALKQIDDLASGQNEDADSMPLQKVLDNAPSATLNGATLFHLKLLSDGFSWEESEAMVKKAPAARLAELDKLPLPSRRTLARDFAYYLHNANIIFQATALVESAGK